MQEETTTPQPEPTPIRTWGTPAPTTPQEAVPPTGSPVIGEAPLVLPDTPIVPESEAEQLARQEAAEATLPEAERAKLIADREAARVEAEKIAHDEAVKAPTPEALEVRLDELEARLEEVEASVPIDASDLHGKWVDTDARKVARDLRVVKRNEEADKAAQ